MAGIPQLLEALNTKGAAVSLAELAKELGASNETTLKQLKREKDKGTVDGNVKEGWLITDGGRKALETEIHPTMIDEGVTPRQQFEAIGQRIGIKGDRIVLAADIVWSGDYTDIKWVWEALGQADIANDLRSVWVNAWRAKLHKAIPPELEVALTGATKSAAGEGETSTTTAKVLPRDFIIVDDEPVRVGSGLGDYSLQDAKDIMAIRALKSRFAGVAQAGAGPASAPEKLSELLTALGPYLNKGADVTGLKEMLTDKLLIQKQDILSHIPQQGTPSQPKTLIEQLTELSTLGPVLKSILGVPESSGNPGSNSESPIDERLKWRKFLAEERRSDERHNALMGLAKTVRENVGDGVAALKAAASEAKGSRTEQPAAEESQTYECGQCHAQFKVPRGDFEKVACPSCHTEYTKEALESV